MNKSRSWISRVPTECNIGDGPSRDQWDELQKISLKYVSNPWTHKNEEGLLKMGEQVKVGALLGQFPIFQNENDQ